MAQPVKLFLIAVLDLAAGPGRDAGSDALAGHGAEPVAVIALVTKQGLGLGQAENSRAPLWSLIWPTVRSGMNGRPWPSQMEGSLEFSPPLVRPIRLGTAPFCRLAAVKCSLRCAASIMIGGLPGFARQLGEDAAEYAKAAPADEAVVDGLVRAVAPWVHRATSAYA